MTRLNLANLARMILPFVLAVLIPSRGTVSAHAAMLKAGDEIDGMTLTSGAAQARPLWAFCSSQARENMTTANCEVPQMEKLAIGHVFFATDSDLPTVDWSDMTRELYIDGQPVALHDFPTYDYVLPTMAPDPSPVREVFMKFTAWDLVLTNLQPGEHTIEGRVHAGHEELNWVVNLLIQDASELQGSSSSEGAVQSGSICSVLPEWLARLFNSCRVYGLRSGTLS